MLRPLGALMLLFALSSCATVPAQTDSLCVVSRPISLRAKIINQLDHEELVQIASFNSLWHSRCD